MKLNITVVYPVSFEFEVPNEFVRLSEEEKYKIRSDILDKADNLFGNNSEPVIHAVQTTDFQPIEGFDDLLD